MEITDKTLLLKGTKTFIKYADDENGTNMTSKYNGQVYMGTYVGKDVSTNPADYTWMYVSGHRGTLWFYGKATSHEEIAEQLNNVEVLVNDIYLNTDSGNVYSYGETWRLIGNLINTNMATIDGVLTEEQMADLYNTLEDGRYAATSEEYGPEILLINKENSLFKRMTGGYDYTYDFDLGDWVIASGGGGGGGGTATVTLVAQSPLEQTVAVNGKCEIQYFFKPSVGSTGTVQYYVDNVLKKTGTINKGVVVFDASEFIKKSQTAIKVVVTDTTGATGTITYLINGIELKITSTFDDTQAYTGTVDFRYTPYGSVEKTVKFIVDGKEHSTETVKTTGETLSKKIYNLTHGVHTLEVQMSATIDGTYIESNTLKYNIIAVQAGNSKILISSKFDKTNVTQGELLSIDYIVYNPAAQTTNVKLRVNNEVKADLTVNRTKQFWNLTDYPTGTVVLSIDPGENPIIFTVNVEEAEIKVDPVNTNLELSLSAQGRSNSEAEAERTKWNYESISASLTGFNYSTNGWMQDAKGNDVLRLNGNAKVVIPFNIFATDFLSSGKTIEFDFSTTDIYDISKILVTCFNNEKGFKITSNECTLKSEQKTVTTKFKEDERVRVSFVIESTGAYRLIKTFINGILSGLAQYPTNDDFTQANPVGITINPDGGSIDIYSIRVYNMDLNNKQMLDNYMADLELADKVEKYTRNNILDDYGNVSFNKIKTLIPVLTITGPLPGAKGDKKTVKALYENPFDTSFNFEYENVTIDVQGTSSQFYPRKNYKLKFVDPFVFYSGAVAEKEYTFKADYMESSHSHNTGNAKLMNELSPKFPTQAEGNGVRNAINGFPIVIFVKENEDATPVYYGVYNFNNDKGNSDTLGLTTDKAESWEFKNNTSARCLFRSNDFTNKVSEDFEARYPDKSTNYTALARVVRWVYSTEGNVEKFKNEFENYFNKEFCLFYYVMMETILAVDSRAKNMFLDTTDGVIWHPRWYDIDTSYGLNNEGVNQFGYGLEQHDAIDNVTVFNGENSLLWNNFEEAFEEDIKEYYQNLRSSGKLTYDKIIGILHGEQISKISEAMYNTDGQFKYEGPLREDNDATYLYVEQGSRLNHLKWWLNNRFRYLDSKYEYADFKNDFISMRTYTPSEYVVAPNGTFDLKPFTDMYLQVLFGSSTVRERGKANETKQVTAPEGLTFNNTETIIYGASKIIDVGDLSTKYARTMDFSKATKLKHLKIGNATAGYQNTNLNELSIGNNTMLETLDIQNCPNLTQAIDLSGCMNIREVKAKGTSIVAVTLADGGNLEKLELPNTVTNLSLVNQPFLSSFSIDGYDRITSLRIEGCPNINEKQILNAATNVERVRITNVDWKLYNNEQSILNRLMLLRGLNENGASADKAVLTGKIHIAGQVPSGSIDQWNNYFGYDLEITADEVVQSYTVTFVNWDGTVLETINVLEGGTATYSGETPTRPDTEDGYQYEFSGWSASLTNITSDMTVTAVFASNKPTIITLNLTDETLLQPSVIIDCIAGNYTVDWGDGNVQTDNQTYTNRNKTITKTTPYASTGVYTIKVLIENPILWSGTIDSFNGACTSMSTTYTKFIVDWKYQEGVYQRIRDHFLYNAQLTIINIPEGVEYISYNAFDTTTTINSLTLPSTLRKIKTGLFKNGNNPKVTIIKSKNVLTVEGSSSLFKYSNGSDLWSSLIQVPAELLDAYKADSYWSKYTNITAIEEE